MNEQNERNTQLATNPEMFEFANADKTLHDVKFETKPVTYLQDCLRRFAKNKASVVAGIIILIIVLFAIFEPLCDWKSWLPTDQFPNGYIDANLKNCTPKLSIFEGTGFWDGTEVKVVGKQAYDMDRFTDANHPYVVKLEKKVDVQSGMYTSTQYHVRYDTTAMARCINLTISESEYNKLVEYDASRPEDQKVMKGLIDVETYLANYTEILKADPNVTQSAIANAVDAVKTEYDRVNGGYYFAVVNQRNSNGDVIQNSFEPLLEDTDNDGVADTPVDIYMKDENGNVVTSMLVSGRYRVRVDYYDYFTFKYGHEPSFIFGTNLSGQDICLRLALGCRFSLMLGIIITIINFLIGLIWGAISGYYGGTADLIMERITDIIANIPSIIVLSITQDFLTSDPKVSLTLGDSGVILVSFLVAFVVSGWVGTASTTRMQFYRFKGQEYVLASRTLGAKDGRLIFKHILPNAAGTLVTSSVLMVPSVIFSESSLSYLGIVNFSTSATISSLGAMLTDGKNAGISTYPHEILFPAIVISLLMISFNLFGNGLRDAFNTTLRGSED